MPFGLHPPLRRRRLSAFLVIIAIAASIVPLSAPPVFANARFHIECDFVRHRQVDPIVSFGKQSAHLHAFFGNTGVTAVSTYTLLRQAGTTCNNKGDKAAYWIPALKKNGNVVQPVAGHFYYRGIHRNLSAIKAYPPGLKVIAGNAHATQVQSTRVIAWSCQGSSGTGQSTIRDCGSANVKALIKFQSCWDGKRKDSADHKSHMRYATRLGGGLRGCTRSHPVPVPELTITIVFPIHNGSGVTLSSGPFYTMHADFFNAWNQTILNNLISNCIHANKEC